MNGSINGTFLVIVIFSILTTYGFDREVQLCYSIPFRKGLKMRIDVSIDRNIAWSDETVTVNIQYNSHELAMNKRLNKIIDLLTEEMTERDLQIKMDQFKFSDEYLKCKNDFPYFLDKYVLGGKMLIRTAEYKNLLKEITSDSSLSIKKLSRGAGVTTLLIAFSIWRMIFWNEDTVFHCPSERNIKFKRDICNKIYNLVHKNLLSTFGLGENGGRTITFDNSIIKFVSHCRTTYMGVRLPKYTNIILIADESKFVVEQYELVYDIITRYSGSAVRYIVVNSWPIQEFVSITI